MKKLLCLAALLCVGFAGCGGGGITGTAEDRAKTTAGTTTGSMAAGGGSTTDAPKEGAADAGEPAKDAAPPAGDAAPAEPPK